jgi:hypothetical protein
MKKNFATKILGFALVLTLLVAAIGMIVVAEETLPVLTQFGDLTIDDAQFAPNPDYDKFTVLDIYIENADANVLATVSAKMDESEYYVQFKFYGDDQTLITDGEGVATFDEMGFLSGDSVDIINVVKENAIWSGMPVSE